MNRSNQIIHDRSVRFPAQKAKALVAGRMLPLARRPGGG
jgi:hypothetical protein